MEGSNTVTVKMGLDVQVDCDERCFELPQWRELLDRDPNRHVFATPEWNRVWWEEFGANKDLFLLTMRRAGEIAAVVPLYRKQERDRKIFRFMGGIDLSDYLGPICSEEDRDDVAEALVAWLDDVDDSWDEFDAHNMPVPFGFAEFLVDHSDRRGFSFSLDQEETSAVLALAPDWDSYLESLDSKDRHELRRKRRRFSRQHPDARVRSASAETLERDMKTFINMHRGAEGHKGHFMRPEIATFFQRVARAFVSRGWLRLDLLEVEGRALASTFGFQLDDTYYLYNSSFEPEARRVSPGVVLVSELVKTAIEDRLSKFDFLRGPERYKYDLGSEPLPLHRVRVFNKRRA